MSPTLHRGPARRSWVALTGVTVAVVLGLAGLSPATASDGRGPSDKAGRAPSYTNAVSDTFSDTFADPSVIRGKDGWWYSYGTTDPLREGEGTRHLLPISRSRDLVSWEYVGDAFTVMTLPTWADTSRGAALWAPDIRYVDGQYRLYYVVTETTGTVEPNDNAVGVATSPTPTGPWTDAGAPVVGPRRGGGDEPGNFLWTFDPSHVVGPNGAEYLFYGSYYGGIWVTKLATGGMIATGEPTMVAIDNKYEGAYTIQRDGWWYLFASSANCCAGPTTGYSVHVGRSRDVTGPYGDREGVPLAQSRAGGTPVLAPNGNRWVGPGHNAVVTDLAGQDWIAYHAIDRADPYLDAPFGINERPMLLDRLDWIDGWPTARAGAWASQGSERGPVTTGRAATDFTGGVSRDWRQGGTWTTGEDADAGTYAESSGPGEHVLVTRDAMSGDVRVEADLRRVQATPSGGAYGVIAGAATPTKKSSADRPVASVSALLDPVARTLVVRTVDRGRTSERSAPLPVGYLEQEWHNLALEVLDGVATVELTHARLGDPLAVVSVELPRHARTSGLAGAAATGPGVQVDNLSALPAAEPVTGPMAAPVPGTPLPDAGDEFNGPALVPGWTQVRSPAATLDAGMLRWPVEEKDLTGTGNDAGLLLRDPPAGDWTAETKLTIDLGTDEIRNFQQAGIVAYVNDDLFARLSHVAIWNTRQTEFGKEMPYATGLSFGGTIVGPPSDTTWLRLTHRTDVAGERELQASTSTDGVTWVHGGVWTLPADADLRVGLISHGARGGVPATAQFDYLRFYAD